MKRDHLDKIFENLKDEFDVEAPNLGHQKRFLSKLNTTNKIPAETSNTAFKLWKPLLAVAATVLLCFSLITIMNQQTNNNDLASVSPEMSKTQDFFTSTIENELNKLNEERTPQTKIIIDDALVQLKALEKDYESLKDDLAMSGDDTRVVYAMISNFQNRIDVLKNVMARIDEFKLLKQITL